MTTSLRTTILAAAMPLLLAGCGSDRGGLTDASSNESAVRLPSHVPIDNPFPQDALAKLWIRSEHDDWDAISAAIDPAAGGVVSGVPASWPADYVFSVEIPPGAIDTGSQKSEVPPVDPEQWVDITILVPRYHPDAPDHAQHVAVYRLQPHGLQFTLPVTVTFCYPPWRAEHETYLKYHFWREDDDGAWIYYVSDYAVLPAVRSDNRRLGLQFQTTHFSRWGMQNGAGGDGITGPDGRPLPPMPRPRIQEAGK
ncbi:MAG: hypothetical protein IPK64_18640 [bacterium]|nr:hypothetical protein [bacterium]